MANSFFEIRQENYSKPPSAEQRKVFNEAWRNEHLVIPPTRIEAHLKIRELLADRTAGPIRKEKLKAWRALRKEKRAERRARRMTAQTGG